MRKALYILTALVIIVMTPAIAMAQGSGAPACFVQQAGADAGAFTTSAVSGDATERDDAVVVTTTVALDAVAGGRTIVSDAVRYVNTCDHDLEVALTADSVAGDWGSVAAEIWLSKVAEPSQPIPGILADEWADQVIRVAAGSTQGPLFGTAGTVVGPAGAEVRSAFVVTAAAGYDGGATIRWTADARPA